MLLNSNTEKVMNLVDMIDDLKGIDKIRLAIHLLEESYFFTEYNEKFIELLNETLEILDPNSKKVITNFAKYNNLLFISAKYMELSLEEKKKFSVEMLFNIFQYDFRNEEINTKINQQLDLKSNENRMTIKRSLSNNE